MRRLGLLAFALLLPLYLSAGSGSAAADCTIASVANGAWNLGTTWDLGRAPNSTDHVCIEHTVTYSNVSGTTSVLTVTSTGTLSLTGGTLNLTDPVEQSSLKDFALAGGTFGGEGSVTVTGTLAWTGGAMSDAGTTVIAPAGTLRREGTSTVFLQNGRLLEIEGVLDVRNDQFISVLSGAAPLIRNTGTVVKSVGAGIATIAAPLENDGVLRADSGTLTLTAGDGDGSSEGDFGGAAAVGQVRLTSGSFDLGDGAGLLGTVDLGGTTMDVVDGATATASGTNKLSGGAVGGTGTLSVTGTLRWTGGSMRETGTTRVEAAATVVREEQNTVFLESGRLLEVLGTLDLSTDRFIAVSGAAPLIRNEGTVVKSAGAGTAVISPALENDGLVRSDSGILDLRGGDGPESSDGDFGATPAGGSVNLSTGAFDLADGAGLLGSVNVAGATVAVEPLATATAAGANALNAGAFGGTGALNVTGTLSWTGGSMEDAGTTRVQPSATLVREQENTVFLETDRLLEVRGTLDVRTDRFISTSGAAPLIHVLGGSVVKSAGSGTATISAALENDGVVRSTSGTLALRGGGGPDPSSGDFGSLGSPGALGLDAGTFDLADGSRLLGGVAIGGGVVDVVANGTATASGANALSTGAVGGTGTLSVTGTLTWTGGSMRDAGTTRIESGGKISREAETTVFLENGRLLDVRGLLDLRTDRFISTSGAAPRIHNLGTVRKSAGGGAATIAAALENDGVVEAAAGTLDLRGGDGAGSSSGDFGTVAPGLEVSLGAGVIDLANAAHFLGGVALRGATVNVEPGATATATGVNTFAAGALGDTGTLDVPGGTLVWSGGTMRDGGTTHIGAGATLAQQGNTTLQDGRLLENDGMYAIGGSHSLSRSGTPSLVRNDGTIERTSGTATATIAPSLDNDGTVRGLTGLLALNGGDGTAAQSGTFEGVGAGRVAFTAGSWDLGAGTSFAGGVRLGGGDMTIPAGVTVSATGANEQVAGSVDGAGTLRLDGPFEWNGGAMQGAGRTVVPAGRELTLSSLCCQTLGDTRTFVVEGTLTVAGGALFAEQGTRLENTGLIRFQGADASEGLSGDGLLVNTGAIRKTAGAGASTLEMVLTSSGEVRAETGTLELGKGDGAGAQTGVFGGGPGEVVFAWGEWDLAPGSRFDGSVAVDGADLAVAAGHRLVASGAARLGGGSLGGPGDVAFEGTLAWTNGVMGGNGITEVAPAAVVTLGGVEFSFALLQDGRLLLNRGRIDVDGGQLSGLEATILNEGILDFRGDADLFSFDTFLHNTGTIRKSAGAGETELRADLDNDGTVEATSGRLTLQGSLLNYSPATRSLTAGAFVARDATLALEGAGAMPLHVNAATIVLDGPGAGIVAREDFDEPEESAVASLLRNAGAGELRLEGGADVAFAAALRNAGLLVVGVGSNASVGGAYVQSGGRTELRGPGSILEATAYTQTAGTLLVETAAGGVGRVDSAGAAALAGSLAVETRTGFVPAAGSTFRFLQAGSRTGTFASVVEVAAGVDYTVDYDGNGAALRVLGVTPAPAVPPAAAAPAAPRSVLDDRVLAVLSGQWTRKASPGFYGGTYTMSSRRGATLVRVGIEARQLVLLVSTCRGCGSLEAYWNGRLLKRIALQGRPARKHVVLATFPSVETGTLALRVASRRQVRVDGLVATQ